MRQRSRHLTHRSQSLIPLDARLEFVCHRNVMNQQQSSARGIQRAFGNRHTPFIQQPLVRRIGGAQALPGDDRPIAANDRLTEHAPSRRIRFADQRIAIQHHNPRRQGIKQQRQSFRQCLLLLILTTQFAVRHGQLTSQRFNFRLQCLIGLRQFL